MSIFMPRIRICNGNREIFDEVRKKFVSLTPEELVRQQLLYFLMSERQFPAGLLQVEGKLSYNNKTFRADIIAYGRSGKPLMIAECKAADVEITQKTFEQIARYNLVLKVPYLLVSNGLQHFFCRFDPEENKYCFEKEMPNYNDLFDS